MMHVHRRLTNALVNLCAVLAYFTAAGSLVAAPPERPTAKQDRVDFVRDIQPILTKHCLACHGADSQEGNLRLDAKTVVFEGGISGPAIVAGKPGDSLLLERLLETDKDLRMPLEEDPLSKGEIELVRKWIAQGAIWPDGVGAEVKAKAVHWAYIKPVQAEPPVVSRPEWVRNAVDAFVLARLDKQGLPPSPPAERALLLRRLYLDLTGLPPSVKDVDAFLSDNSPNSYERVVQHLLDSPAFGERWARHWLDLARYADSNGYQADQYRDVWPYRDWVIRAINDDMPFDQFTIEQIAGDLLPNSTLDQKVATGFHRQTTCNVEAGVDPEENRVNQIIDRVNTTGTVWLGTSIECGQCHNHKYDPFTQDDYYGLFAFFNNTPMEVKHTSNTTYDFYGPKLELPYSPEQEERLAKLKEKRAPLQAELEPQLNSIRELQPEWEKTFLAQVEETVTKQAAGSSGTQDQTEANPETEEANVPAGVLQILKLAEKKRKPNQKQQLEAFYIEKEHPEIHQLKTKVDTLDKQIAAVKRPTSLVMIEQEEPRDTHILKRGNFLTPAEQVQPHAPRILHGMNDDFPRNRLGLAQWLVSEENPLVARVTVNRWWAEIFGQGIVRSEEDFGTQGEPPTHPELLDWLAVEFMRSGWSMKHVLRLIVMSNTYQQSSRITPELLEVDPTNELLARGARFRLPAEMVRDNSLAICGNLSSKMAGPPVFPPQPAGVWRHVGRNAPKYATDSDEDRFRRGIYVIWRRSAPYPSFMNFDAPERSACVVQRPRTNTPLQALTLLNDEAYIEMAKALARRILTRNQTDTQSDRLVYGFRLCTSRQPKPEELELLNEVFDDELKRFQSDPKSTNAAITKEPIPSGITPAEFATWFYLSNILLNLDETITKG